MQIEAVTFDVGGTLLEPWPSVGHVYSTAAARHGARNIPAELLNERFKAAWRGQKDFAYTRLAWAELVDQTFRGLVTRPPSQTFFPELYEHFARPAAWRMFEDVMPSLDALASSGTRLGIISNWDERLRILLKDLRLEKYFEAIVISCDVGFAKPSPVIFEHAAEKLGVSPAAILHVGDSTEMDVAGAKSAGFQAARIRRAGSRSDPEISSLMMLPLRLTPHKSR